MRRILVENARRKAGRKHGGGRHRIDLDDARSPSDEPRDDLLALDEALDPAGGAGPAQGRAGQAALLRRPVPGGAAAVLGISPRTATRYWAFARAWLFAELARRRRNEPAPKSGNTVSRPAAKTRTVLAEPTFAGGPIMAAEFASEGTIFPGRGGDRLGTASVPPTSPRPVAPTRRCGPRWRPCWPHTSAGRQLPGAAADVAARTGPFTRRVPRRGDVRHAAPEPATSSARTSCSGDRRGRHGRRSGWPSRPSRSAGWSP